MLSTGLTAKSRINPYQQKSNTNQKTGFASSPKQSHGIFLNQGTREVKKVIKPKLGLSKKIIKFIEEKLFITKKDYLKKQS